MAREYRYGFPATAAKPFVAAGKRYAKGEAFDYAGIDELNVRGMWMAEQIDFATAQPVASSSVKSEPSKQQHRR